MTSATTAPGPSFAPKAPASAATHPALRKVLLACGIASSLLYVVVNVVGSLRWQDYDSTSQTVSELFAIDAPSRSIVVPLLLAYDALVISFGCGAWASAGRTRALRAAAAMVIGI